MPIPKNRLLRGDRHRRVAVEDGKLDLLAVLPQTPAVAAADVRTDPRDVRFGARLVREDDRLEGERLFPLEVQRAAFSRIDDRVPLKGEGALLFGSCLFPLGDLADPLAGSELADNRDRESVRRAVAHRLARDAHRQGLIDPVPNTSPLELVILMERLPVQRRPAVAVPHRVGIFAVDQRLVRPTFGVVDRAGDGGIHRAEKVVVPPQFRPLVNDRTAGAS